MPKESVEPTANQRADDADDDVGDAAARRGARDDPTRHETYDEPKDDPTEKFPPAYSSFEVGKGRNLATVDLYPL